MFGWFCRYYGYYLLLCVKVLGLDSKPRAGGCRLVKRRTDIRLSL